jgi:hypothetical protein
MSLWASQLNDQFRLSDEVPRSLVKLIVHLTPNLACKQGHILFWPLTSASVCYPLILTCHHRICPISHPSLGYY